MSKEQYAEAVARFVALARQPTSGGRVVAQMLLSAYNGSQFQLDLPPRVMRRSAMGPSLLIVDEIGYLRFSDTHANLFFQESQRSTRKLSYPRISDRRRVATALAEFSQP